MINYPEKGVVAVNNVIVVNTLVNSTYEVLTYGKGCVKNSGKSNAGYYEHLYNKKVIINIYKEKSWTSFDVVANLRVVFKIKKIGHAGTLDPLAEGVLIILVGKDTKRQDEIMRLEKEYLAEIAFNAKSPTYDLEGALTFSKSPKNINLVKSELSEKLENYVGTFEQQVPAYSAVKVGGEKLYEMARKGKIDEGRLPVKEVNVKDIKLEKLEEKEISGTILPVATLRIICSKGFYVRSFAHDLGQDLGVGGVLTRLVRTRVGDYMVEDAKKINEVSSLELD